MSRKTLTLALSAASLVSCANGLKVGLLRSSARRPSNVAVYFTVDTSDNKPVAGLTADKFVIYEDRGRVSEFESKQTILNPQVAASHYTLLLIDMSGSVVESKHVDEVVTAASAFTQRVEKYQKVGVYAFDGSPDLYPIVPFTESSASATSGVARLKTFAPRDPSTNLHGAVVEALKTLRKSLDADPRPLKFGTLVVFTDGTDRANRVSKDELDKALDAPENKSLDVFAIGVGAEMNNSHLEDIGRSGTVKETDQANLGKAFDDIASRVEGMTQRYYLLSYCSPARAGEHEVTIEAHAEKASGTLRYKFTADGFGPNCDPSTPPNFDIGRPPAVADDGENGKGLKVKVRAQAPAVPKATVTVSARATANAAPASAPAAPAPESSGQFSP
jgi:Mg-chelatase subunit ChlD